MCASEKRLRVKGLRRAHMAGWSPSNITCLDIQNVPPLGGLSCTLYILPHVAYKRWRLNQEWAIVGGFVLSVWLCCCMCCCRLGGCVRAKPHAHRLPRPPRSSREHRSTIGRLASAGGGSGGAEASCTTLRLEHGAGSQVCFTIRDSARGGTSVVQPSPPPMPPPPASPPPTLAGVAGGAAWVEHVDPLTGDRYYEDAAGHVTWDAP